MKTALHLCFVVLALAAPAAAQDVLKDKLDLPRSFVSLTGATRVTVAAGKPGKVELRFRVAPGYHINSDQPRSELLLPTKLRFSLPTDLGVGRVRYSPGKDKTFAFASDQPLNVYEGEFTIAAVVSAARTATPGNYKVHGTLKYQACDDRNCYRPRELAVAFEVRVGKSALPPPARPAAPRGKNPPQSPHIRN